MAKRHRSEWIDEEDEVEMSTKRNVTKIFDPDKHSFIRLRPKKKKIPLKIAAKDKPNLISSLLPTKFAPVAVTQDKNGNSQKRKSPKGMADEDGKGMVDFDRSTKNKRAFLEAVNDKHERDSLKSQTSNVSLASKSKCLDLSHTDVTNNSRKTSPRERQPKRKSSASTGNSSPLTNFSSQHGTSPKRRKLLDISDTPKLERRSKIPVMITPKTRKNSKTPNSNNSQKHFKHSDHKHHRQKSPNLVNPRVAASKKVNTPEYMKIKEEESILQEKKDRRRRKNKIISLRTSKGQPVMRGRINLMLEKIKADLGQL